MSDKIKSMNFKEKYKKSKEFFTRDYKLPFSMVIVFVIQKSSKSLQNTVTSLMNKIYNINSKAYALPDPQ